jgi:hypothetical protein
MEKIAHVSVPIFLCRKVKNKAEIAENKKIDQIHKIKIDQVGSNLQVFESESHRVISLLPDLLSVRPL